MYSALSGFDFRLAEAAYDLGATKGVVLRRMGTLGLFPPTVPLTGRFRAGEGQCCHSRRGPERGPGRAVSGSGAFDTRPGRHGRGISRFVGSFSGAGQVDGARKRCNCVGRVHAGTPQTRG